jgi:hypothetical protein
MQRDFAFFRLILPNDPLSAKGVRQNRSGLVLMNLVVGQIDEIEMVFTELLQMAYIFLANFMAFSKGRSLEFVGSYFGDVPFASSTLIFFSTTTLLMVADVATR